MRNKPLEKRLRHSQWEQVLWQAKSCLLKARLWMQALMKRPNVVVVVDRPSLKLNSMLRLDMPSIELHVIRADEDTRDENDASGCLGRLIAGV